MFLFVSLFPGVLVAADLQAADRLLHPAVTSTLESLELAPEDAAAAKLAETYARALDQARAVEAQAEKVLRLVDEEDVELHQLVSALKAKLGAQTTLATIGPRLVDVLDRLGANPRARANLTGKGGASRGSGKLAQLRAVRQ